MIRITALLVCSTAAAILGCGGHSQRAAVGGRVTFAGQPLASGEITFVSLAPDAGPSAGAVIRDGRYQIAAAEGPVAGEYQVQIRAFRGTGKKVWDGMGDERAPASQKNYVEELEQYIPAKYNDASELKAVIVAGKMNELDFDLPAASPARKTR